MKNTTLFNLEGRVAIVTGGGIGLGRQMAEGLAEMGANLVLCARKKERCEQAADELRQLGVNVLALACDVKDPASVQAVVSATMEHFGRLDILFNNAGTSWGARVEDMTLDQWNKVIETNLTGTFLFSQAAGKVMIGQKRGKIVNISSVAGLRGSPLEFSAIGYAASKGGINIFTRDLACKWGMHNIQVNAIAPGWFPSDMSAKLLERNKDRLLAADASRPLRRPAGPEGRGHLSFLGRVGLCDGNDPDSGWRTDCLEVPTIVQQTQEEQAAHAMGIVTGSRQVGTSSFLGIAR